MSIKKQYLKSKPVCKVTFRVPKPASVTARKVCVVGEFNGWNVKANPMKSLKNGEFTATIDLETEREYQFRYLINETVWENDGGADKFISSTYGNCENSVVII